MQILSIISIIITLIICLSCIKTRLFQILWRSRKHSWKWIALELGLISHPFMLTFFRNGYAKQWFCNVNIFPIAIFKNNSTIKIGLSLFIIFIGFNFQWDFNSDIRKKRQRNISFEFVPFTKYKYK